MSEYQYYEFQAVDRALNPKEQDYIQTLSSRVQLTPTSAVFVYHYGDFRGSPKAVLEQYFDAMLYVANWGTKQLMFRLPKPLIDESRLAPYCEPDWIDISTTETHLILNLEINEEPGMGWIEGAGLLSNLIALRDDLLRGDFRALYLTWLKAAPLALEELEEEELLEPPVPANLQDLSPALQTLVDFFEIDENLIEAAAQTSPNAEIEAEAIERWIPRLSEEERNEFLTRLVRGEPHLNLELINRLRSLSETPTHPVLSDSPLRTFAQLRSLARQRQIQRQEEERRAAKIARIKKLEKLVGQEEFLWNQVLNAIARKQSKAYDEAVGLLLDLRDLAEHQGKLKEFQTRMLQIQEDYSNRSALRSRLQQSGLWQS